MKAAKRPAASARSAPVSGLRGARKMQVAGKTTSATTSAVDSVTTTIAPAARSPTIAKALCASACTHANSSDFCDANGN
jgi:hypothetical protein